MINFSSIDEHQDVAESIQKNMQSSVWGSIKSVQNWVKWDKVFKSGPIKMCGRQPLKNVKRYGLL